MSGFKFTLSLGASALLATVANAKAEWNYAKLGEDWGEKYSTCKEGKEQSPIDFNDIDTTIMDSLTLELDDYHNYNKFPGLSILNKGYTIQGNFPETNITDNGDLKMTMPEGDTHEFHALQMHVHAPSEHTVLGYHFDAEIHLVHLYADGSLGGVIGVFFDREKGGRSTNPLIQQMIQPTPTEKGRGRVVNLSSWLETLNIDDFYAYKGSLTTPPCTEGINWRVLQDIQPLSQLQFEYLSGMWLHNDYFAEGNGNHRKPQPLNERVILASSQPENWSLLSAFVAIKTGSVTLTTSTTVAALAILGMLSQ